MHRIKALCIVLVPEDSQKCITLANLNKKAIGKQNMNKHLHVIMQRVSDATSNMKLFLGGPAVKMSMTVCHDQTVSGSEQWLR